METIKQRLLGYLAANPQGVTIFDISKFLYGQDDPKTLAKTRVAVSRARVGGKVRRTHERHTYGVSDDPNSNSQPGTSK